jgi:hypothetical protein
VLQTGSTVLIVQACISICLDNCRQTAAHVLQAGADAFARNAKGETPLGIAQRQGNSDCISCVWLRASPF